MSDLLGGTYTANCAILSLPVADVNRLLTRDCALSQQSITPVGYHPVILMLGDETNVRFLPPLLRILPAIEYLEVTLAVPWVVYATDPGTVMAQPSRLWLNKFVPMFGGRIVGFPKRLARMAMTGSSYSVRSFFSGLPVLSAQYGVGGQEGSPTSFSNYGAIAPIFEEVFLLHLFCLFPAVAVDMHWEMERATMQSLDMTLDVQKRCDPGIPAGSYSIEGIDQQVTGAFRLTVPWRLRMPRLMR